MRNMPFIHDAPMYNMTIYWSGKKRSADDPYILNMDWSGEPGLSFIGKPPGAEELEKFFRSLAEEYKITKPISISVSEVLKRK